MSYQFGPYPKLSDWEIDELRRRARAVCDEHPAMPFRRTGDGRKRRLAYLADEYGIHVRTLYRYLRRAA